MWIATRRGALLILAVAPLWAWAQGDTMPEAIGVDQSLAENDDRFYRDETGAATLPGEAVTETQEQLSAPTHYYLDPYYAPADGTLRPSSVPGDHQYQPADVHLPEGAARATVTDRVTAIGEIDGRSIQPEP